MSNNESCPTSQPSGPTLSQGETITKFFFKGGFFCMVFVLFTMSMIAVSISLNCNRNEPFMYKLSSALFAFMFGLIYILINYIGYRLLVKKEPCSICIEKAFLMF